LFSRCRQTRTAPIGTAYTFVRRRQQPDAARTAQVSSSNLGDAGINMINVIDNAALVSASGRRIDFGFSQDIRAYPGIR